MQAVIEVKTMDDREEDSDQTHIVQRTPQRIRRACSTKILPQLQLQTVTKMPKKQPESSDYQELTPIRTSFTADGSSSPVKTAFANDLRHSPGDHKQNSPGITHTLTDPESPLHIIPELKPPPTRYHWVDKLKIFLTAKVVVVHCIFTLMSHMWPLYSAVPVDAGTYIFGVVLLRFNQAFFMGLFYFLSGFFVTRSYNKKGPRGFLVERAIRLLAPIPVYELVVQPLLYVSIMTFYYNSDVGADALFNNYFTQYQFLNNPLWFILLLFVFDVLYTCVRKSNQKVHEILSQPAPLEAPSPSNNQVLLYLTVIGGCLGVLTFLVRMGSPITIWFPVIGQPAYLLQYIFCYIAGNIAYRHNLLETKFNTAVVWCTGMFVMVMFALMMVITAYAYTPSYGGINAPSFFYSMFEMWFAAYAWLFFLVLFRIRHSREPSGFVRRIAEASYTVYLIHTPITVTLCALFLRYTELHSLVIFIIVMPLALLLSWSFALLIKLIPKVGRVL
ncbi:hypothetical protein HDU96_002383 [Phlyctochytrium bullatum]|nr:hypothetical protein HDU96_002383 [Phlyctochytrium bullatum]